MNESPPPSRHRLWATLSLIAAVLWIIFSAILPTPITTLMGLPFACVALAAGWFSRRRSVHHGDQPSARRAAWGMGLTCAGCIWQVIYLSILGGVGLSLLISSVGILLKSVQGTPTP